MRLAVVGVPILSLAVLVRASKVDLGLLNESETSAKANGPLEALRRAVQLAFERKSCVDLKECLREKRLDPFKIIFKVILADPKKETLKFYLQFLTDCESSQVATGLLGIFPAAAGQGNLDVFKHLMSMIPDILKQLHRIYRSIPVENIRTLINAHVFHKSARSAAKNGHEKMLGYLFTESEEENPRPNVLGGAFWGAYEANDKDMIDYLLPKCAALGITNKDLQIAASKGQKEMVCTFLEQKKRQEPGFEDLDVTFNHSAVLVSARCSENQELVNFLLTSDFGFDPSVDGYFVLDQACALGHVETVQLLLGKDDTDENRLLKLAPEDLKSLKIAALVKARDNGQEHVVDFLEAQHSKDVMPFSYHGPTHTGDDLVVVHDWGSMGKKKYMFERPLLF